MFCSDFLKTYESSTVYQKFTYGEYRSSKQYHIQNSYFQVVFWFVTPCIVVIGYLHFRGPCCLHFQGKVAGTGENGIDIGPD